MTHMIDNLWTLLLTTLSAFASPNSLMMVQELAAVQTQVTFLILIWCVSRIRYRVEILCRNAENKFYKTTINCSKKLRRCRHGTVTHGSWVQTALKSILWETLFLDQVDIFSLSSRNPLSHTILKFKSPKKISWHQIISFSKVNFHKSIYTLAVTLFLIRKKTA